MSHPSLAYQLITDRILALLERGVVPWQQPWSGGWPRNLVYGRPYRGINVLLLSSQPYPSPYWLSFPKQVNDLGGRLRKGEHVTYVVFWKHWEVIRQEEHIPDDQVTVRQRIPILRYYKVVNVEQCVGIAAPPPLVHSFTPLEVCEQVVAGMPQQPVIVHEGIQACYLPTLDTIRMPPPASFHPPEAYYSTLFHELVHSTGHACRLNRSTLMDLCPFGSTNYSREELVAEIGAAFLCGQTGIGHTTIDNSAAYIASWLTRLHQDITLVVHAAAQAQRAVDFILHTRADNPIPQKESPDAPQV